MNADSRGVPVSLVAPQSVAAAAVSPTRALYWSLLRELWESRAIYIAPLATAGAVLIGFAITAGGLPQRRRAVLLLEAVQQRAHIEVQYDIAFNMIMMTVYLVVVFYCLDALYGERRDRSILFWKSLPVSNATTVISKAIIPLVALPLITLVITVATQLIILLLSNIVLRMNGLSPATSTQLPLFQSWPRLLYGLAAMALWNAPSYAWLLLVSAWARRAALLWAVVPLVAFGALEKIVFQTTYFVSFLKYRGIGWTTSAFDIQPRGYLLMIDLMKPLTPARFLSSPDVWGGLVVAAAFLAIGVRLRRYRGPL